MIIQTDYIRKSEFFCGGKRYIVIVEKELCRKNKEKVAKCIRRLQEIVGEDSLEKVLKNLSNKYNFKLNEVESVDPDSKRFPTHTIRITKKEQ